MNLMLYYERVSENVSYLHEDMHALLVYIKLGRDSDGNLRVLSYIVLAP